MDQQPKFRLEKHRWIADLAEGRTFADIGGLWGTVNETVTIAALAGATQTTMVDIQPEGSKWWQAFHDRCTDLGVTGYHSKIADICDLSEAEGLGRFDLVHCAGILYHVSDPVSVLRNIANLAEEYFVIGSIVIPATIKNSAGRLQTSAGTMRCIPFLEASERAIIAEYFKSRNMTIAGLNGPDPKYLDPKTLRVRTGPWWNLFTEETLWAMCALCGAEVLKVSTTGQGAQNVLCRKIGAPGKPPGVDA